MLELKTLDGAPIETIRLKKNSKGGRSGFFVEIFAMQRNYQKLLDFLVKDEFVKSTNGVRLAGKGEKTSCGRRKCKRHKISIDFLDGLMDDFGYSLKENIMEYISSIYQLCSRTFSTFKELADYLFEKMLEFGFDKIMEDMENFGEFRDRASPKIRGKGRRTKGSQQVLYERGILRGRCRRNTKVLQHPICLEWLRGYKKEAKAHEVNVGKFTDAMLYIHSVLLRANFINWKLGCHDILDLAKPVLCSLSVTGKCGSTSLRECLREYECGFVSGQKDPTPYSVTPSESDQGSEKQSLDSMLLESSPDEPVLYPLYDKKSLDVWESDWEVLSDGTLVFLCESSSESEKGESSGGEVSKVGEMEEQGPSGLGLHGGVELIIDEEPLFDPDSLLNF